LKSDDSGPKRKHVPQKAIPEHKALSLLGAYAVGDSLCQQLVQPWCFFLAGLALIIYDKFYLEFKIIAVTLTLMFISMFLINGTLFPATIIPKRRCSCCRC
jgi:hypothetical protein